MKPCEANAVAGKNEDGEAPWRLEADVLPAAVIMQASSKVLSYMVASICADYFVTAF